MLPAIMLIEGVEAVLQLQQKRDQTLMVRVLQSVEHFALGRSTEELIRSVVRMTKLCSHPLLFTIDNCQICICLFAFSETGAPIFCQVLHLLVTRSVFVAFMIFDGEFVLFHLSSNLCNEM